MKKNLFFLVAVLMAMGQNAFAYDFSAVSPSGHTLYYKIIDSVNHYVMLTHPKDTLSVDEQNAGFPLWNNDEIPTGALVLPETVLYDGVTYTVRAINIGTFAGCPIYSVVMANTIDSLAGSTFFGCNYLTNVTFSSSLRYIGGSCFEGAYLGDVVLPPSVRVLKENAFISSHITSITLNDSLEVIESGCLNNNQFSSLYIPASVKYIANPLSDNYNGNGLSITSIAVDPSNPYFDSRNNCNAIIKTSTGELIMVCKNTTIPEGVYSFDTWLFSSGSLDTLVLPSTLMRMSCGNYDPLRIKHLVINSSSLILNFRNPWGQCSTVIDTIHVLNNTPPFVFFEAIPENFDFSHTVIVVPCGSIQAYQAANVWSNFTNIIELGTPQITVNAENGSASVVTYPTCGNDTVTVSATADSNYHFVRWSDGSTQNPYTLVLNGNTTLTALFAIDSMTVNATAGNPLMGTVLGGGTVLLNGTTTLTAVPSGNNIFLSWSNGVTDNPYTLTVTSDTTLQALFTLPDTLIFRDTTYINHYIYDTTFVTNYVHDTMIQFVNQYIHDTTFINNYVHDTTILYVNQYVHDTTFVNNYIHDTVRLTTYLVDTTIVNVRQLDTTIVNAYRYDTTIVNYYQYDTVVINNYQHDTTLRYVYDTVYLLQYLTDTIVIHDTIYTTEGIGGVDIVNARIYSTNGRIVVEGAEGHSVTLFDAVGRALAVRRGEGMPVYFDVPASGTYLVRVGNTPARRIVVVR